MLYIDQDNNIKLTRGDTAAIDIEITDASGEPYNMQTSDSLIFTVKRMYNDSAEVIRKELQTPVLILTSDDTKDLSFGKYRFDIYIYNSETHNLDTFIYERIFEIAEEVHDFE